MKIAIIGHGKMGRAVEETALNRGHEIACVIDVDNTADFDSPAFRSSDVAIEFSVPSAAPGNLRRAWQAGVPVVCGTTAWLTPAAMDEAERAAAAGATLLHSSNFSLGVNVTMAASRLLARLLAPYPEYRASMEETHHVHKLDHPSGTAVTMATQIIENCPRYTSWQEPAPASAQAGVLPITSFREGEVPGTHIIKWDSPADTITLSHRAKSRQGFALGAVIAAEWLAAAPKGRIYTMADVLNLK